MADTSSPGSARAAQRQGTAGGATEAEPKHEPAGKPPDPKTGRTGAIRQNTTNKGYQQDR